MKQFVKLIIIILNKGANCFTGNKLHLNNNANIKKKAAEELWVIKQSQT